MTEEDRVLAIKRQVEYYFSRKNLMQVVANEYFLDRILENSRVSHVVGSLRY